MLRTKVYRSWMGFVESGNRPRDLGVEFRNVVVNHGAIRWATGKQLTKGRVFVNDIIA
jgi:hypothetical protein